MSVVPASLLSEVPGVTNSVQHLQELALRMKSAEFGFSEDDVASIDNLVLTIYDLERECGLAHEILETETIKASILRHKLQFLPCEIKTEIQGAVDAARQSNADELNRLQSKLASVQENTDSLTNRHAELEKDNSFLHPERDNLREQHEEIVSQLNQRLAEKASKQIMLNETRDTLRETNQKIVDLEEGILQLKEDLIQERADARMEKKRLKKIIYDTTLKHREQCEANVSQKQEMDKAHQKMLETQDTLDVVKQSARRYESSCMRLENQERNLDEKLGSQDKENNECTHKCLNLTNKLEEQEYQHQQATSEVDAKIAQLKRDTKSEQKRNSVVRKKLEELQKNFAEKTKTQERDAEKIKTKNEALQQAKQDLATNAEEAARLRQENADMEARIADLSDTHEAIVSTFQKQIDEMREILAKERKDRMDLQGERDDGQKETDQFKVDTQKFINQKNKQINQGKIRHDELTKEGTQLQKTIRHEDETLRQLKDEMQVSREDLQKYKEKRQNDIKRLEDEIETMERNCEEIKQNMVEKRPYYEQVDRLYEEEIEKYDKTKKEIVATKNKKLGLEDAVKRGHRDVEKLVRPTAQLREDLSKKRAEHLEQLRKQSEERTVVENKIYSTGCKLRTVLEENDHFFKRNAAFESEIETTEKNMEHTERTQQELRDQLTKLKVLLSQEWIKDKQMEKDFAVRDQTLVDEMGQLLDKTEHRETVIAGITSQLRDELVVLAQFLENVARRRPKQSRESKRSRRASTGTPRNKSDRNDRSC